MASYTPTLSLKKPATGEPYNVEDQNGNMEKLDAAISKRGWWTLLNYVDPSSGGPNYTTYNSRKISDYSGGLLVLSWLHAGLCRGTSILPVSEFILGREIDIYHITNDGQRKWLAITRVSDTSIRVTTNESGNADLALAVVILSS